MEVEGKTIKEVIQKLLQQINKNVEAKGNPENFSTNFEVKGKDMKEALKNFTKKISDYFEKKRAVFESLDVEIVPARKLILRCSLKVKVFEEVTKNFKEIKILELQESLEGWKLLFSMNQEA
jgi:phenylalanyl-tRNA synthetase alpha subunit